MKITGNLYDEIRKLVTEEMAQAMAQTEGMSDAQLHKYAFDGAADHLAALRRMKAPKELIAQAKARLADLAQHIEGKAE